MRMEFARFPIDGRKIASGRNRIGALSSALGTGHGDLAARIAAGFADVAQTGAAPEFAAAFAGESSRRLWQLNVGLR